MVPEALPAPAAPRRRRVGMLLRPAGARLLAARSGAVIDSSTGGGRKHGGATAIVTATRVAVLLALVGCASLANVSLGAVLTVKARDLTPPSFVFGTPAATHVTDTSMHLEFHMDKQGYFYFIILEAGATPPTSEEVKNFEAPRIPFGDGATEDIKAFGTQHVTTTTRRFTTIVFENLELDTEYIVWCTATDNWEDPDDRILQSEPTPVLFRTLTGRVRVHWETLAGGDGFIDGYNVLGLGTSATHNHNTPTAIPGLHNVTIEQHFSNHFYTLTLEDGETKVDVGDIWHGRLVVSSANDNPWPNPAHISAGAYHWLSTMYDRRVLSMGHNEHGRLGVGDEEERLTATAIAGMTNVSESSAGLEFSIVLDTSRVYTFGRNDKGQLGLGDTLNRVTPTLVGNFSAVEHISAGRDHMLFTENGTLYSVGGNKHGQLGLGDNVDRWTPTLVDGVEGVSFIMAGNYHSIVGAGTQLYAFGYNFRSGGEFYGYSDTSAKCYQLHAEGCLPDY